MASSSSRYPYPVLCNVVDLMRRRERRGYAHFRHTLDATLETSFFGPASSSNGGSDDPFAPTINTNRAPNDLPLNEQVLSTIAIAISHDGELVATTHGDHTIKVRSWSTGLTSPLALSHHPRTTTTTQVFHYHSARQHRTFRGHPRTPWTVKFHPHDPTTIASGCLGFEVPRQTPCARPHSSAVLYNTQRERACGRANALPAPAHSISITSVSM